jgi:ligand-binding sensor domain-containing protein
VARVYTISDGLANNRINSLFQGTDGRFWLGTATALSELLPGSDSGSYRFRNYTTANGLSESGIGPINEDRNGNLWFGTESGGVMKLAANGFTTYGKADGLRAGRIAALLFDLQGELCVVGMEGTRMIQRFNGHGFDATELRLPPGHEYWTGAGTT